MPYREVVLEQWKLTYSETASTFRQHYPQVASTALLEMQSLVLLIVHGSHPYSGQQKLLCHYSVWGLIANLLIAFSEVVLPMQAVKCAIMKHRDEDWTHVAEYFVLARALVHHMPLSYRCVPWPFHVDIIIFFITIPHVSNVRCELLTRLYSITPHSYVVKPALNERTILTWTASGCFI